MSIASVVIYLVIIGVIMWLINSYIPMARAIKTILNAVVVIAVVIWLLSVFGLRDELNNLLSIKAKPDLSPSHTTTSTTPNHNTNS